MPKVASLRQINTLEQGRVVGSSQFFLLWEYLGAKASAQRVKTSSACPEMCPGSNVSAVSLCYATLTGG